AALLISIKVRMLLPRPELDDEGDPIDPRRELVERLLEYMRYKEAAEDLALHHERRRALFTRGAASSPKEQFDAEEPDVLVNTTLFDLISSLRRVLTEETDVPVFELEQFEYSIAQQRAYVLEHLERREKISFIDLAHHQQKGFIIATFLAILEMSRQGLVLLSPTRTGDDFYVERTPRREVPGTTNGTIENQENT
ncbi:MAG: segregation and condensation protein A, partial [Rhodothermales bacterium]